MCICSRRKAIVIFESSIDKYHPSYRAPGLGVDNWEDGLVVFSVGFSKGCCVPMMISVCSLSLSCWPISIAVCSLRNFGFRFNENSNN